MTHRGPFQPLPFCDSVKTVRTVTVNHNTMELLSYFYRNITEVWYLQLSANTFFKLLLEAECTVYK